MKLRYRISNWGQVNLGESDPIRLLQKLHVEDEKSTKEIAELLGEDVKPAQVRYYLRKWSIKRSQVSVEERVELRVKEMGYETLKDFFLDKKNWNISFTKLAPILDTTPRNVSRLYKKHAEEAKGV